jgi:aldehyde dehydrogenase (NAD+)
MSMTTNVVGSRPISLESGPKQLLIGGSWVDALSGRTSPSLNPANGELLATVAEGDGADIDRAVEAARAALSGPWSTFTPSERQRVLLKLADLVESRAEEFSVLDTLDMGAPLTRTRLTTVGAIDRLRWYAAQALVLVGQTISNSISTTLVSYTVKEPVGVVGAITPWNSPLMASVWKLGAALAAGCTVVLKPAEEAPLTPLLLGELCKAAGLPDGVVNVVTGAGETAGARLAAHPDVDKVAFTGSHITGQQIVLASVSNLKRVTLELGGKSPNIVFADANLDLAVPGASMAVFNNAGQICSAGTRLFVEHSIHDEFVSKVAAFTSALRVGDGLAPDTKIGPVVSEQQMRRVMGYIEEGKRDGATVLAGGDRMVHHNYGAGNFIAPTVFADVQDSMSIARDEIFGPVISVIPFSDMEEVAFRANATSFGLAGGVWTNDLRKAHTLARLIKAGTVWINCYNLFDPAVPFGGYKMSGYGREGGAQQLEDYVNVKTLWINAD